ncbi:cache domain-containing protein [Chromobacterium haemolyticum]|nr:cache domain-containing protein [Chromobacterium haemolyticum]
MSLRRVLDSIVTRLLLLALGIVVTGTVARYYAVSQFLREDLSKVVQNQQMALASYVARDVDFKIQQRQALLRRLAAELPLDLLQRPAELQAWLRLHCDFQCPFSQGLYVVTPDGRAVADYPQMPGRAGRNFSDRDYIRIALSSPPNLDRTAIGRPIVGRVSKKPVLPMAAALPWRHGQPQGALAGVTALAAPGFLDLLLASRIGGPNSGFLLISPQDQMFIASSQPDMVLKPTPPTGINPLHDRAMAGFRGVGITVNAQGDEEVSAIASVPSTGWFVVAPAAQQRGLRHRGPGANLFTEKRGARHSGVRRGSGRGPVPAVPPAVPRRQPRGPHDPRRVAAGAAAGQAQR